jgi:hypothetical protein
MPLLTSAGNARYARELAAEAGISLEYEVADILELERGPAAAGGRLCEAFDGVVMEMGILVRPLPLINHQARDLVADGLYSLLPSPDLS